MLTAETLRLRSRTTQVAIAIALGVFPFLALTALPAPAQDSHLPSQLPSLASWQLSFSPYLLTAPHDDDGERGSATIHGLTRSFAHRWKASYALGRTEETDLTSALLRYDQTLAYGTRNDRASRDSWRHFLGVEYQAAEGFSLLGGLAGGSRGGGGAFSGYEKLRLNAGARWQSDSGWGLDGSFSFIPTGPGHFPGGSGYIPGFGDSGESGSAYLFALSVTRRF